MVTDENESPEESEAYLPVGEAAAKSGFSGTQIRNLVAAGVVRAQRSKKGGVGIYCVADLLRLAEGPRVSDPDEQADQPLIQEFKAFSAAYKDLLDLALKQTRQAQEHERLLITAFSKPLENLGDSSKNLVTAVLDQNAQLVKRADAGDVARIDFLKATESMLRDQRVELAQQAEADRKHQLKIEVWEGVKKAGPHLLEGLKQTIGSNERLQAAKQLKEKLDPALLASMVKLGAIDTEQLDLICKTLELDRAEIEALANEPEPGPDPEPEVKAAE